MPEALAIAALSHVSGLYARSAIVGPLPLPSLEPAPNGVRPIRREEIRLDVDGRYPQMTVSGTISGSIVTRIHWIAQLSKIHPGRWTGAIWYKDGATASFPYTAVDVRRHRKLIPGRPLGQDHLHGRRRAEADRGLQVHFAVFPHRQLRVRLPGGRGRRH